MERERYFEAKEFKNIKEIIYNSAKEFANNVAFIIKHKKEKEVEYENITYKKLLEDINSFGAKLYKLGFKNKRIAIVGRNGAGKTSLLKAIINNEMLEEGIGEEKFGIYKQGSPKIGYLRQIEFENTNNTMLEEILKVYEPIIKLEEKISKLEAKLQEESNDELIKNYTESLERYEFEGGYTYKKEYEKEIKKYVEENIEHYEAIILYVS